MEDEYLIQLHVSGNVTLGNRSILKLVILMENFNEGMQALSSFSSFWKASLLRCAAYMYVPSECCFKNNYGS